MKCGKTSQLAPCAALSPPGAHGLSRQFLTLRGGLPDPVFPQPPHGGGQKPGGFVWVCFSLTHEFEHFQCLLAFSGFFSGIVC